MPEEQDERSVITVGQYTVGITLPREWVSANNVAKGDKLHTRVNRNGDLVISVPQKEDKKNG